MRRPRYNIAFFIRADKTKINYIYIFNEAIISTNKSIKNEEIDEPFFDIYSALLIILLEICFCDKKSLKNIIHTKEK